MPIRFRCAYCNQLMGIAKRKAGSVITCPKCAGQVVVPTPDPSMEEEEQNAGNPGAAFEEDEEMQNLLEAVALEFVEETKSAPTAAPRRPPAAAPAGHAPPALQAPAPVRPPPAVHAPPPMVPPSRSLPQPVVGSTYPAEVDVVPLTSGTLPPLLPARGLYLTPGIASILLVFVALLLGLAFFLGFLLGRS